MSIWLKIKAFLLPMIFSSSKMLYVIVWVTENFLLNPNFARKQQNDWFLFLLSVFYYFFFSDKYMWLVWQNIFCLIQNSSMKNDSNKKRILSVLYCFSQKDLWFQAMPHRSIFMRDFFKIFSVEPCGWQHFSEN